MFDKVNVTTHLTIIKGDPEMLNDPYEENAQRAVEIPHSKQRVTPLQELTSRIQTCSDSIRSLTDRVSTVTTRLVGPFPSEALANTGHGHDSEGEYNVLRYNTEYLAQMIQELDQAVTLLEEQT